MHNVNTRGLGEQVALNTVFNYLGKFVQVITSLYLTRILFFNLGSVNYGFWQLLWMVFGYSLLLDFGFGSSIKKYTAEYTISNDVLQLNGLLSSVLVAYSVMTSIIVIFTLIVAPFLDSVFTIEISKTTNDLSYYKMVFVVFGLGAALVFPAGVFLEILSGLGRNDLCSVIRMIQTIVNLGGIFLIFESDGSLLALAAFSVLLHVTVCGCTGLLVFKRIPGLRVSLRSFSYGKVKTIVSFSFFAYLVTFSNMVILKTDQIVLGVMLGMSSVTIYHIGSRIAKIMSDMSIMFQVNMTPIAAALYKEGDMERLRWVMFKSNKITAFITTGVFIIFMMLFKPVLYFWLKVAETDHEVHSVAVIMLVSLYILTLLRSSSSRFMLMCEQHRYLAGISVFEALANLILSIILVSLVGLVGVAWGTLIPNVLISLFIFFPFMCRFGRFSMPYLLKTTYLPVLMISIPTCIFIWGMTYYVFPITTLSKWSGAEGAIKLGLISASGGGVYSLFGWLVMLNPKERKILLDKALNMFKITKEG